MKKELLPSQEYCCNEVLKYASPGQILFINGARGTGKSLVLRSLANKLNGELLTMTQFMEWQRDAHPLRLEETLEWLLMHHLAQSDAVLFDDLDRLLNVFNVPAYPRKGYIDCAMSAINHCVENEKKLLVCVCSINPPSSFSGCLRIGLPRFTTEDYKAMFRIYLGDNHSIDAEVIKNTASGLNGYQLKALANILNVQGKKDTQSALEVLANIHQFTSEENCGEMGQ